VVRETQCLEFVEGHFDLFDLAASFVGRLE